MNERLPIEDALPALRGTLAAVSNAVVVAPPGAGKTTKVPLALLGEDWLRGGRIVMLEPRRIAARGAARRMASQLGERVGRTVGYRTRGDTRVSEATRIEVVTEGVLTRMLQGDPSLDGVGAVVFDEFHERSLHADLGLALALQAQALFRADLRIVVMSATLEAEAVSALLGGAPVVKSEGRIYPVETVYAPAGTGSGAGAGTMAWAGSIERRTSSAVREAMARHPEGDALVFLPGGREIRRVAAELARGGLPPDTRVATLYGALSAEEQDAAVAPSPPGARKVVLATSIAETSLTVEGVRIVVDAGLSRVPRYSPRTGLTSLATVPVTRAAADQRRGRAGRVAPGVCYRLWTEEEHRRLAPYGEPEIREADLSSLALELALWGAADPGELAWLDPPPEGAYRQAQELLRRLGALDDRGVATAEGRRMAELGMHPRLAHMTLRAAAAGSGDLACELAALLESREGASASADIRERVEALRRGAAPEDSTLREEARRRMREAGLRAGTTPADQCGELLALAFPDRVAMRRGNGKYTTVLGRGAELPEDSMLSREPFLAIAELDGAGIDSRIRSGAPLASEALRRLFAAELRVTDEVFWDEASSSVRGRRRTELGALLLEETPLPAPDSARVEEALLHGIALSGLAALPWTKAAEQWLGRLRFLRRHGADEWPDASPEALLAMLPSWLGPYIGGMRSKADLARVRLFDALEGLLTWDQRRRMDEWAPTHVIVPSGSRLPVDYSDPDSPALSVKLQELFGWAEAPRLAGGRVPLTLKLLSPAQRPVQITRDLAGFWRTTYFEIKKDLRGRYPKHYWPDDPLEAVPTRGGKPRGANADARR